MTPIRSGLMVPVLFVALALTAGCNLQGGQSECVVGTAGCSCVHGDACDPGLSCQAGTCLGPGGAGSSGEPAPAGGPPLTSEVLVRFCHDIATVPEGQPFELQLGSARLTAATGQCSQPAGQACVAVPPGKVPVKLKLAGQVKDFGTRELAGGKAYLLELDQAKLGGEVVAIPGRSSSRASRRAAASTSRSHACEPTLRWSWSRSRPTASPLPDRRVSFARATSPSSIVSKPPLPASRPSAASRSATWATSLSARTRAPSTWSSGAWPSGSSPSSRPPPATTTTRPVWATPAYQGPTATSCWRSTSTGTWKTRSG